MTLVQKVHGPVKKYLQHIGIILIFLQTSILLALSFSLFGIWRDG